MRSPAAVATTTSAARSGERGPPPASRSSCARWRLGTVAEPVSAIRAPWSDDAALIEKVAALRAAGEIVIQVLPGHEQEQQEFACDRELVMQAGRWNVRRLDQA